MINFPIYRVNGQARIISTVMHNICGKSGSIMSWFLKILLHGDYADIVYLLSRVEDWLSSVGK